MPADSVGDAIRLNGVIGMPRLFKGEIMFGLRVYYRLFIDKPPISCVTKLGCFVILHVRTIEGALDEKIVLVDITKHKSCRSIVEGCVVL